VWGKAKTGTQVVAVALLILGEQLGRWQLVGVMALWLALALTVASMVVYLMNCWPYLQERDR
jgi:phosphatidylglycerophosphate synthase